MSLYSFHGRGTLERHHSASGAGRAFRRHRRRGKECSLQRSAHIGALTDSAYVQLVGAGVAAIDLGFPCRYTHSSLEVCDLADLDGLTRLLVAALPRIDGEVQPRPRRFHPVKHYLGIDIGTFESKGVLVADDGAILATASKPHRMHVPQPAGRSTARAKTGGTTSPSSAASCSPTAGSSRRDVQRGRRQRHRSLHASGRCRRRAADERDPLWRRRAGRPRDRRADRRDRRGRPSRPLRQRAHLAIGRPQDPVAQAKPPGDLRADGEGADVDVLSGLPPDRQIRHRPLYRRRASVRSMSSTSVAGAPGSPPTSSTLERLPDLAWTTDIVGAVTPRAAARDRAWRGHAGDCRDHRRCRGGAVASGVLEARRHDDHVRLDHLHHHDHGRARPRPAPVVCALALPAASTPSWPGSRPAERSATGSATQLARDLDPATAAAALAAEAAEAPPGAKGLVFLPYFSGERTPIHDPHAKGMLFGLNLTHTRADIYRAAAGGHRLRHESRHRDLSRSGTGPARDPRRRRRHQEPRLGTGNLRRLGPHPDRAREDDRRVIR